MLSEGFYRKAACILDKVLKGKGSWKTLCLAKDVQQKKLMYGLICELLKYRKSLIEIIEAANLFHTERRIPQTILLILTYELLIMGSLRCDETYKAIFMKHKTRLNAEFVRLKIRKGCTKSEDLAEGPKHKDFPKYLRINTLKGTLSEAIAHYTKAGFDFSQDEHIDNLLVFAPATNFSADSFYLQGKGIIQDKASCFPAFILAPDSGSQVLDSCAAPGNKTTHLAMMMQGKGRVVAFEMDPKRFQTLKKLTSLATEKNQGTSSIIECKNADFLAVNPNDYPLIEYALVDPSCSGSGMIQRMDHLVDEEPISPQRLAGLAEFQVAVVLHAMKFPAMKRVVYSTCSVHDEENEQVVERILEASGGKFRLSPALPAWKRRGIRHEECIRVDPQLDEMNGFFVALFEHV